MIGQQIHLLFISQNFIIIWNTTDSVAANPEQRFGILLLRINVEEIDLLSCFKRVVLGSLHVELFEQLDSFLGRSSHWLVAVYSALVEKLEQLVLVTQDLATEMCTQRVDGIDRDSFCVWVLGLLYLINEYWQELVVVEAEFILDVEDD